MKYRIAELIVEMDTWGKTKKQAAEYEVCTEFTPDIKITSDIDQMKTKYPTLSLDDCEYLSSGSSFARGLLYYNGIRIHSSAVVMDGYAYLFTANSGTGKSTHTTLWRQVFGDDRAKILNDDKPALRVIDDVVYAYGTPWSGKTDQNINMRAPVAGICLLERGEKNIIERIKGSEVILGLLRQTPKPKDMKARALVLENLDKVMRHVPIFRLQCNMDPEAAMVSYEAMRPKNV